MLLVSLYGGKEMADNFKMYVTSKKEEEPVVYEDRFPEGTTLEDLKEQHGVVIWCKYAACINNKQFLLHN